ncbi:MAG: HAMP domain-containing sensor histidine kinase [Ilumatobacteraceae bacterium]
MKRATMRARMLSSFAAVALTGAAAFMIAVRVMVPRLFDEKTGSGRGGPAGQGMASQHEAVVSAVNYAMLVALAASLLCSAAIALLLSRRSLRSLDRLRAGTRGLAAGRYDARVDRPTEPELAALADDVNHLAATLEATEQRRAALIGDVAHEMRTPLTTMGGVVEGFHDGLFSADEMAATVGTEVERLHHLARDLAAVSRSDEGQTELDLRRHDVRDLVTTVCERLRAQFDAAGVDLVLVAPAPLPGVVDGERTIQALTNLIGNGLTYTPAGGRVTVSAAADGPLARIAISDTGRGLRPSDLERVFERFYRAEPHDRSGGTGIGLTISRAIARAHGGDLVARSGGPGLGSTFELSLPASGPGER